ncbi:MAG: DUF11 domain-containing protein [Microthrixaceae bacterium]|nr:DUF11 domain-containing protein [Microthrixaceae bacterium]
MATTPTKRTVTAEGSDTLGVTGVDIAVTKTADVATRMPTGDHLPTLTVENRGGRDADAVVLTDTLGDHVQLVAASGANTVGGNTITWEAFPLAAGDSTTRTVTVEVANPLPSESSSTTNVAEANDDGSHGADTDPSNNDDSVVVGLGSVVDLAMDKSGPGSVGAGDTIEYSLTVANLGDREAHDAIVTDTLGPNLVFVAASGGGTYDPLTRMITWSGVDLTGAAGTTPSAVLTVEATVADPMPSGRLDVTNDAQVDHPDDVNPDNDTDSVTTDVEAQVDLVVTKDDGVDAVVPGDTLTYTVRVTNTGTRGATGVTTVDTLDANHRFVSASGGGVHDPSDRTITWDTGVVEVGSVVTYTVEVTVADPLVPPETTSLTNTVVVDDDDRNGFERTPDDNTDSDTDTTGADLSVTKDLTSQSLIPGAQATYTIKVANAGPMTVADLSVNDTMPSDLSLVSAEVDRGSIDSDTWLWSGVDLAPGETATLTVVVEVDLDATGAQTNTVTVTGVGVGDPDPADNTASVTDPLDPTVDLSVTKALEGTLTRGETAAWTIVVSNHGPSRATEVVVTDTLPDGLAFAGATGEDGATWRCETPEPTLVSCALEGSMDPGDTAELRLSTTVAPDAPSGEVVNHVTVSAAESETGVANNSAEAAGALEELPAPPEPADPPTDTTVPDAAPAQDPTPSSLSFTGTNPLPVLALGFALCTAGLVLLGIRRRRAH